MRKLGAFCRRVDAVNEWTGRVTSVILIFLALYITAEVILRYVFNRPSIWTWDILIICMCVLVVLGGGYTLLHRGHVMVDVLVGRFSPRARAIIDLVTSGVFFFAIGYLLWIAIGRAEHSVLTRELYSTLWEPPLYPLRVVVAIGIFLLLIQGMAKFVRDVTVARSGIGDAS